MPKHQTPLARQRIRPSAPEPKPSAIDPVVVDPIKELRSAVTDLPDPRVTYARQALIAELEKRARVGHGTDADRELMKEAALMIRALIGLEPDSELSHIPKPVYAPVKNDPPIGHSLPYERQSDR